MTEKYEDFTGKKVTLTVDGETQEGTVEAGSPIGIVFKPKGSSRTKLIEAADIQGIELIPVVKRLRAKVLPRVLDGKHRDHLIDRHGFKVADIEAMTEEQAKEFHDSIDHSELGHKHKELSPVEQAIEEAAADPDED